MKKSIGKMVFINRNDPVFQSTSSHCDFEVNSINPTDRYYEGRKLDGTEFHCSMSYWQYQPYSEPKCVLVAGKHYLMNFYDRSGDNWEPVKILFVGKDLFVYERDGVESSAYIQGNEFRELGSKK